MERLQAGSPWLEQKDETFPAHSCSPHCPAGGKKQCQEPLTSYQLRLKGADKWGRQPGRADRKCRCYQGIIAFPAAWAAVNQPCYHIVWGRGCSEPAGSFGPGMGLGRRSQATLLDVDGILARIQGLGGHLRPLRGSKHTSCKETPGSSHFISQK